ncbi:hypothetical protein ACQEVC_20830 [Plantactinospora sp. CA-294935]|uniref:hypothetical protein n=1 Tax=Plantactinospora sp. CA-294935 TaxID=3240012 RepID=UPI003D8E458D
MEERVALITGVSRRVGIAAAVARRFAAAGYRLQLTGLPGTTRRSRTAATPRASRGCSPSWNR